MKTYRSNHIVKAILFDPDEPGIYEQLEELGLMTNRKNAVAYLPEQRKTLRVGQFLVFEVDTCGLKYGTMHVGDSLFSQDYELIEEHELAGI